MQEKKQPVYSATPCRFLNAVHGRIDSAGQDRYVILRMAHGPSVEQMAIPLDDVKRIAMSMLASLATYYADEYAQRLLNDHFRRDENGDFRWPRELA